MKQTVKDFITSHKLIDKGDTIVAAVSGGLIPWLFFITFMR